MAEPIGGLDCSALTCLSGAVPSPPFQFVLVESESESAGTCRNRIARSPSLQWYESSAIRPNLPGIGTRGSPDRAIVARYTLVTAVASYLDRLLDPLADALTSESASALLNLRADPDIEARVEELRRKANEGTLTPAEDAEYKDFVEAVDVVSIVQAKARRFLSRQAA